MIWPENYQMPFRDFKVTNKQPETDAPICPNCGTLMQRSGSCHTCPECGQTSGCA